MTTDLIFRKPAGFSYYFINGDLPENIRNALTLELSYHVKSEFAVDAVNEKTLSKWRRACSEAAAKGRSNPPKPELWDGRVRFLYQAKSGSYYFPVGLLPRVMKLLKWYDVHVTIDAKYDTSGLTGEFEWSGPDMRDYQIEALVKLIAAGGGIASMPTGSGKTLVALKLIYAYSGQSLVLVHRKELLKQWCREIEKNIKNVVPTDYGSDAIKVYIQMRDDNEDHPQIVVAMVPTLAGADRNKNLIAKGIMNQRFDLLLLDEAHHCPADTFYAVASRIDAKYKYGLSATTKREAQDDMKMEACLGQICVDLKADGLIGRGVLATPMFEFIDIPATNISGRTFPEIYKSGIVMNEDRNKAIAARVTALVAEGRQTYVHVEHLAHGRILSQLLNVPFIYSKSLDRDAAIEKFRAGEIRVLISTLMSEGVDIENISAICMAGGRKTESGTIQRVGRALRPDKKFGTAIIVDFADRGKYLADHTLARYNAYVKFYGENIVLGRANDAK